ncbi:MAG: hydroxymethylbilane synthase [Acidobacteriota bacterium]
MKRTFTIGTRGSDLALWQSNYVKGRFEASFPNAQFELKIITTTGDRMLDTPLSKIGDKGLFTRQIESQLLNGDIDFAVHSLKDLQTAQPAGLTVAAVCERERPNDAFISRNFATVDDLPHGAKVATGSLRRRSQLLHYRPDLRIEEIRGNVPTRIKKFEESDLDAMILAFAGLERLGLAAHIRQVIPFEIMLPAVGQGAVAIETRADDPDSIAVAEKIDHYETHVCIEAERAFLRRLEGGCQVPIGALAQMENDHIRINGLVGSLDGTIVYRELMTGTADEPSSLGIKLAEALIANGALELLAQSRADAEMVPESVI